MVCSTCSIQKALPSDAAGQSSEEKIAQSSFYLLGVIKAAQIDKESRVEELKIVTLTTAHADRGGRIDAVIW